jgi:hypothetical protein
MACSAAVVVADEITFRDPLLGQRTMEVNVVGQTDLGDLLIESRDSRQWTVRKGDVVSYQRSARPVSLWSREELVGSLSGEFSSEFHQLETKNYIVIYSTSEAFAKDAGKLFERIKSVFENYLRKQLGFEPTALRQPMVAVIFGSQEEYVERLQAKLGPAARQTGGVYIPQENRLYLFDMLGGRDAEWFRRASSASKKSVEEIALLLETDTVSTVIHEGVHQVAYNTGFHDRHVCQPIWLVEGLATLLEVPDLDAKHRWAGVGQINWDRAEELKRHWGVVSGERLEQLISKDDSFRTAGASNLGYAQAWGLTYFLTKTRKESYCDYVHRINRRPKMVEYSAEDRLRDFEASFGQHPARMEPEFKRYLEKNVFKRERPTKVEGTP